MTPTPIRKGIKDAAHTRYRSENHVGLHLCGHVQPDQGGGRPRSTGASGIFQIVLCPAGDRGLADYATRIARRVENQQPDGTFLSALACDALDASDPASYLALGWKLGDALEHQHVPSVLFAHWPNRSCEFSELLARVSRRTPALGKWKLADDYFANTDQPYHQERLSAGGFQHNWLMQKPASVGDSPATNKATDKTATVSFAAQWRTATQLNQQLQARCRALQNLLNLAWQLEQFHRLAIPSSSELPAQEQAEAISADKSLTASAEQPSPSSSSSPSHQPLEWSRWAPELAELVELVEFGHRRGDLEPLAEPHIGEARPAETMERASDGLALRIEQNGLGHDLDDDCGHR